MGGGFEGKGGGGRFEGKGGGWVLLSCEVKKQKKITLSFTSPVFLKKKSVLK